MTGSPPKPSEGDEGKAQTRQKTRQTHKTPLSDEVAFRGLSNSLALSLARWFCHCLPAFCPWLLPALLFLIDRLFVTGSLALSLAYWSHHWLIPALFFLVYRLCHWPPGQPSVRWSLSPYLMRAFPAGLVSLSESRFHGGYSCRAPAVLSGGRESIPSPH